MSRARSRWSTVTVLVALSGCLGALGSAPAAARHQEPAGVADTVRVSLRDSGDQLRRPSYSAALSRHGRYVAFATRAQRLVPGDDNQRSDVFVRDRATGVNERVSVASGGSEAAGNSTAPAVTPDGRYVAFTSDAPDLVAGDTNGDADVFVHDRLTGLTERVSVSSRGRQGSFSSESASISADGRFVAFVSPSPDLAPRDEGFSTDVFVHDRVTGRTERVSVTSDGQSAGTAGHGPTAQISANGRYVAFTSRSTEFVPREDNFAADVFVHDRTTGATEQVSVSSRGRQGDDSSYDPVLSAGGRYVAFSSYATNLAGQDTNGFLDVYVHDRSTGQTERVSVSSDGQQADSGSVGQSISAGGRFVAFTTFGVPLVPGDTNDTSDVFVRDVVQQTTVRVSVARHGGQADDVSFAPAISSDGRHVAFESSAGNLVPGDTNAVQDIVVRLRFRG